MGPTGNGFSMRRQVDLFRGLVGGRKPPLPLVPFASNTSSRASSDLRPRFLHFSPGLCPGSSPPRTVVALLRATTAGESGPFSTRSRQPRAQRFLPVLIHPQGSRRVSARVPAPQNAHRPTPPCLPLPNLPLPCPGTLYHVPFGANTSSCRFCTGVYKNDITRRTAQPRSGGFARRVLWVAPTPAARSRCVALLFDRSLHSHNTENSATVVLFDAGTTLRGRPRELDGCKASLGVATDGHGAVAPLSLDSALALPRAATVVLSS